jgi:hypothetical protein
MKEFVDAAPVTAYSLAISRFAVVFFADCLSLSPTAVIAKTSQEQSQGEFQCRVTLMVSNQRGVKLALKYLLLYTPLVYTPAF